MSGTTDNLAIAEVATNQTNKELIISTALNDLDDATQSPLALTFVSNALTLTATQFTRNFMFIGGDTGGNLTATGTLTVPATNREFAVHNTGSVYAIVVTAGTGGVNATVAAGTSNNIYSNGTNVVANSVVTTTFDVVVNASPFLNNGTINSGQTITAATLAAQNILGNGSASAAGVPQALSLSSAFTITAAGGTLELAPTLDLTGLTEVKVPTPVNTSDAVTKAYADASIQGLSIKPTAVVATTTTLPTYTYANGTSGVGATLTATATGTLTIDSHLTALGDVILVKNETSTNQPYNGLYTVTTAGASGVAYVLTRSIDMDASAKYTGALIAVGEVSTTYPGTLWLCNQTAPTVGTTNIGFTEVSAVAASQWSAGTVTAIATGLTITSGTLSATGAASQWNAGTVGAISSSFTISGTTLALAPTLDLTGLTEVKVPTTTNSTDAAQKAYVDAATSVGLILAGYLSGCTLSWASNTTFSVSAGQVMSDDNTTMIQVSALTKSSAGTWVAGNAADGLDTGTIGAASWYHVYVIYDPTTKVQDILFSLSASAPTLPSGYTKQRRIGSLLTASSNFVNFTQNGDRFDWLVPVSVLSNVTIGTTAEFFETVTVPTGVVVAAMLSGVMVDTASPTTELYLSSSTATDNAASGANVTCITPGAAGTYGSIPFIQIMTSTTAVIRGRVNSTTLAVTLNVIGWIDRRGAASAGSGGNWNGPVVTAIGNGFNANGGTLVADGTISYNATAAATLTIVPLSGISDVIVNMPSAGGTVTLALTPAFSMQKWTTHIKQGVTAGVVNLNTGFVFAPTGGPASYTATPTANVRDMLWMQCLDGTHAVVGAVLQGITI